ncbi:hypothetical protein AAHC03_021065 [Spirometra sp. Aus1]
MFIYLQSCSFDFVHFGHANVVRQAKCLGDYLVVGIHNDEEISKHKGPPVFTQDERYTLLCAVKWVDEVVKDAPYVTQLDVLERHNCDFCVHGDDITTTADGLDTYALVKAAGKYVEVGRTEGISTTDLLYRMLHAVQRAKHRVPDLIESSPTASTLVNGGTKPTCTFTPKGDEENSLRVLNTLETAAACAFADTAPSSAGPTSSSGAHPVTSSSYTSGITHYLPNALRIADFVAPGNRQGGQPFDGIRSPRPGETVIYVPGTFDLFHVGHVEFLKKCRDLGTYIIIGLYSDESAALESGRIGPILTLQERLLSLLACRYVNNVIMDPPYNITEEMLDFFKVNVVAVGNHTSEEVISGPHNPMTVPQRRGIFRRIDSGSEVTTRKVIWRIIENQHAYEARNRTKEEKEARLAAAVKSTL